MSDGTWVLLRGLTRESRHWGRFPQQFQDALPQARVRVLDLPGNGLLNDLPSPTQVDAMAAHCRAALLQQGVPPPYQLLAMSLGAMVATAWAERYPGEVDGAVLINTSLRPFSPFYQRLRPRSYAVLLRRVLGGGDARAWEQTIHRLTTRQASAEVIDAWVGYRESHPVSARNAWRQLWAAMRYQAPVLRPMRRALILTSRHDGLVDTRCSEQLAQHWQADIARHPDAGHDLPLDDADWVVQQVRDWSLRRSAVEQPGPVR